MENCQYVLLYFPVDVFETLSYKQFLYSFNLEKLDAALHPNPCERKLKDKQLMSVSGLSVKVRGEVVKAAHW